MAGASRRGKNLKALECAWAGSAGSQTDPVLQEWPEQSGGDTLWHCKEPAVSPKLLCSPWQEPTLSTSELHVLDQRWIKCWILILNLLLQLLFTGYWKWNKCKEFVAFFVCFHCQSTGICPWPTPKSQCVVLPITENHYTRGDKQLIISRLYMPIRLSILESTFICHHICILIADERNWILNLLAPSEGKQSRRVY